ncbi:hypothetical protein C8F01DRAFT_1088526 [Mycena amicta]|nr:hypothetical protein C8F01DRAFT_1088526 [Mycena amicta]
MLNFPTWKMLRKCRENDEKINYFSIWKMWKMLRIYQENIAYSQHFLNIFHYALSTCMTGGLPSAYPTFIHLYPLMTASPKNTCFLLSKDNFLSGWLQWAAATIRTMDLPSIPNVDSPWDLDDLWRHLAQLDAANLAIDNSSVLYAIMSVSARSRRTLHSIGEHAHHPRPQHGAECPHKKAKRKPGLSYNDEPKTQVCLECKDLPEDQKCIRVVTVEKRSKVQIEDLNGALFTYAKGKDVVGYSEQQGKTKICNPRDENFVEYGSRPGVFNLCRRDITIFQTKEGIFRFCVQYQAFTPDVYDDLCSTHVEVGEYANKKKRSAATQATGNMALDPEWAQVVPPGMDTSFTHHSQPQRLQQPPHF